MMMKRQLQMMNKMNMSRALIHQPPLQQQQQPQQPPVSECEPAPHLQQQGPRQPQPPTTQDIFREFCNTYRSILYLHNLPCAMDKLNTFQKCLGLFINLRTKDDERCHSDANSEVYVDKTWQLYCTQTTNNQYWKWNFYNPTNISLQPPTQQVSYLHNNLLYTSVLNLLVKIL